MSNKEFTLRYFKVYVDETKGLATFEKFKGMFNGYDPKAIEAITKMYNYGGCKVKEVTFEEYKKLTWEYCAEGGI